MLGILHTSGRRVCDTRPRDLKRYVIGTVHYTLVSLLTPKGIPLEPYGKLIQYNTIQYTRTEECLGHTAPIFETCSEYY